MQERIAKLGFWAVVVCLSGFTATSTFTQVAAPSPPRPRVDRPPPPLPVPNRDFSERTLATDPRVNLNLGCISRAKVSVNGWSRDEVRVFVRNGTPAVLRVREKDPKSGLPNWIVIAREGSAGESTSPTDCLSGDRIDIEAPIGSSVTINGRQTEVRIDSVRKAVIRNLGGKVSLRNVKGGITAETFEGEIVVESSAGQINLRTSSGNILAYDVKQGDIGELMKANTSSGTITLQNVEHRQIEAGTVSGSLIFGGTFLSGGIYNFKSSNGAIKLALPATTSCRIVASYGFGSIETEIPMKTVLENISPGGKSLHALIGSGDALLTLTTTSGKISLTKQ
ncbi:MAG TPA: hypothetical protein PKD26_03685 [Pyrinomonadaceae bacterium]|nr:hypothetical protein [Pyrinomonadaceae bacterium]